MNNELQLFLSSHNGYFDLNDLVVIDEDELELEE